MMCEARLPFLITPVVLRLFPRMNPNHPKDPLHGVTLEMMLNELVAYYGWEHLGGLLRIRCFHFNPSIKSSLSFLRKTPWARTQVEGLYQQMLIAKSWDRPSAP